MKVLNMYDFLMEAGMQVLNGPRDMSAYDGKPFRNSPIRSALR
jgi:hypothetical protein